VTKGLASRLAGGSGSHDAPQAAAVVAWSAAKAATVARRTATTVRERRTNVETPLAGANGVE
jgi:hypothetical protein